METRPDFSYLPSRSRLECLKDGFESIPAGTHLPLQVTEEKWTTVGKRAAADGTQRNWTRTHREYIIRLTGPDGTIHQFLTDSGEAARAAAIRVCPAGRNPPVMNHSIGAFVEFFHVPVPDGCNRENPGTHSLLTLLEAITAAACAELP